MNFGGVQVHCPNVAVVTNSLQHPKSTKPTQQKQGDIRSDYFFQGVIGTGTFGEVFSAQHRITGKQVVVKKVLKQKMKKTELLAGVTLSYPGIPQLYGHYQDDHFQYLAMEYMPGEDLFTFLENRNFTPVSEATAKKIFRELAKIVAHAHSKGLVHRDIKLENILVDISTKHVKVSLIDWGLCDFVSHNHDWLSGRVGSLEYVSPEVISRPMYPGKKTDIWSLGVILFALLFAVFPLEAKQRTKAFKLGQPHPPLVFPQQDSSVIINTDEQGDGAVQISPMKQVNSISKEACDLVSKMLCVNPVGRPTIQEVLNHKWLKLDMWSWLFSS